MPSKRRSIGAAFERSPSEQIGEWSTRNMLSLLAALIVAGLFWVIANVFIDKFFNFLATNGDEKKPRVFDSDDPEWIAAKIFGALVCVFLVCRRTTK